MFFCVLYVERLTVYEVFGSHFSSSIFIWLLHCFLVWNVADKKLDGSLMFFSLLVIWTLSECYRVFGFFGVCLFVCPIDLNFSNLIKLCLFADHFRSVFHHTKDTLYLYFIFMTFSSVLLFFFFTLYLCILCPLHHVVHRAYSLLCSV